MARRDASIRLTLEDSAFAAGIARLVDRVRSGARSMGGFLKSELHDGLHKGIEGVRELGGEVKHILGLALPIGGALSFGEMAHHAIDAAGAAGRVAMKLRALNDESATSYTVLDQAHHAATKYKLTIDEAVGSYEKLLDKTGEPVFSEEALSSVALLRNSFRSDAESATAVVAMFRKGLGATAETINGELAPALHGTLVKAGITLEQLAPHAQDLGALMYRSNMRGADGLKQMIGLLGVAKDKGGDAESRIMGVRTVLDKLGSKRAVVAFGKEAGVDVAPLLRVHSAMERLHLMMGNQKGMRALEQLFLRGGQKSFFEGLVAPLKEAHDAVLAAHGLGENAVPNAQLARAADLAGLKAFDEALARASDSARTEADLKKEAEIAAGGTQRKLTLAMDRMAASFENEKFLSAVNHLADVMPQLAERFEQLLSFTVEHPLVGGAAIVGAQFAASAGSAVVGSAAHKAAVGAMFAEVEKEGEAVLVARGVSFGTAAGGALTLGAAAFGLAAGVAIGKAVHEAIVEPAQRGDFDARRNADLVIGDASVAGSLDKKKAALGEIRKAREALKRTGGGFTGGLDSVIAFASGTASPSDARKKQLDELTVAEMRLKREVEDLTEVKARERVATEAATRARNNSTRGVRPPAPAEPGAAPPRGG